MGITDSQSSVYDQIVLKADDREIYIPLLPQLVATIEDMAEGSPLPPPELRMDWVQTSDHQAPSSSSESDLRSRGSPKPKPDSAHNLESTQPCSAENLDPGSSRSDSMSAQDSATKTPTHIPLG